MGWLGFMISSHEFRDDAWQLGKSHGISHGLFKLSCSPHILSDFNVTSMAWPKTPQLHRSAGLPSWSFLFIFRPRTQLAPNHRNVKHLGVLGISNVLNFPEKCHWFTGMDPFLHLPTLKFFTHCTCAMWKFDEQKRIVGNPATVKLFGIPNPRRIASDSIRRRCKSPS